MSKKCDARTEVYSRVCGFFRPVQQWNRGKREEFKQRREFVIKEESHGQRKTDQADPHPQGRPGAE
jgi:ribonucleoside-triphosphate reductase